jgi:hypothetical protein
MSSFDLQDRTRIGAINLPSEFVLVLVLDLSVQGRIRGRAWEHLAEERFMGSEFIFLFSGFL